MNEAERIIAILVDRLGGDVQISCAELENTDFDLFVGKNPCELSYVFRTHRMIEGAPDGEIIDSYLEVVDRVSGEMMATALREIEA